MLESTIFLHMTKDSNNKTVTRNILRNTPVEFKAWKVFPAMLVPPVGLGLEVGLLPSGFFPFCSLLLTGPPTSPTASGPWFPCTFPSGDLLPDPAFAFPSLMIPPS